MSKVEFDSIEYIFFLAFVFLLVVFEKRGIQVENKKNKLVEISICTITALCSWIFFIVFLYSANVKEVSIAETVSSFAIFIACAFLTVVLGFVLYRGICAASSFSIILAVFFTNFSIILTLIQKLFPQVRYWHLLYIDVFLAVLLGHLAKRYTAQFLLAIKVVCIVYVGLIVINLVTTVPTVIRKMNADINNNSVQGEMEIQGGKREGTNIYYILCDEYGSFDQLMQEYGYENTKLRNCLVQNGFNISENSFNYATATHIILSNLMSLDYVADVDSTVVELDNYCKNGALHGILNENGYSSRGIGETAWLGFDGTIDTQGGAQTADGESFETIALRNTFLSVAIQSNNSEAAQKIVDSLEHLINMQINPSSSEFIMIYIKAPHHPYYFKSDGSMNMPSKYNNVDGTNSESYLGEIEWLNGYLEKGITRIIENDPTSIIVLCSDHGNRFGTHKNKEKILNAIYYKGEERKDILNLSGINTLKYILNHELDISLEYTDNPK